MSNNLISDDINYDDIPELTKEDFAKGYKNPLAGKFRNDYTIIVEHADYDEIITVSKKRRSKGQSVEALSRVAEESLSYEERK